MEKLNAERLGARTLAVLLVCTMASWGANMTLVKLLSQHAEPVLVAAIRMALATVFLLVITIFVGVKWPKPSIGDATVLFACSLTMVYVYQIALCEGVSRSSATNSSLIVALIPIVTLVISSISIRARPTRMQVVGMALGLIGVFVVVLNRPDAAVQLQLTGDALLMLAVLGFAVGGILVQKIASRYEALCIVTVTHGVGAVMLMLHALTFDSVGGLSVMASAYPATLMIVSALIPAAVGNAIWYKSISKFGAARTSPALYLVPIFGLIVAQVTLEEPFSVIQIFALGVILSGTYLASYKV